MNDQKNLFRRLELVTSMFILASMLSVCLVIFYHYYQSHLQVRTQIQRTVEDYFVQNNTEIAEAMYFNLEEDLKVREKVLQARFGGDAFIKVEKIENNSDNFKNIQWRSIDSEESLMSTPIFFGSERVGAVNVKVSWDARNLLMLNGIGIYLSLLIAVSISLIVWIALFSLLKRKYFSPLMKQVMERERVIATTDTARMLAHDVKRPFNLLYSFLQSLEYVDDLEVVKKRIERTLPKAKLASASLQNLIDSTMKEESEGEFRLSDVFDIVMNQLDDLVNKRPEDISISFGYQKSIRGNQNDFVRIFQNIVCNALEASQKGDKIEIYVDVYDGNLQLSFRNEGSAISDSMLKKIFHSGVSHKQKSNRGEGLASVKRIISKLGGTISANSENFVTTFSIKLPAGTY